MCADSENSPGPDDHPLIDGPGFILFSIKAQKKADEIHPPFGWVAL
jgi:hypothetical protein